MSLRWPLVALDVGAGAHRARTGTVGRAGPRGGLVEGEGVAETRVVADGVDGVSSERDSAQPGKLRMRLNVLKRPSRRCR